MKSLLLAALLLLAIQHVTPSLATPDPGPLAEFAGNYRGTNQLTWLGSYSGPCLMKFSASPSGQTGIVNVRASVSSGGSSADTGNVFRLNRNQFSADLLAPLVQPVPSPQGKLTRSKRILRATATPDPTLFVTFHAALRKTGRTGKLTVTYRIYSAGALAYQNIYTGTRRLRASE